MQSAARATSGIPRRGFVIALTLALAAPSLLSIVPLLTGTSVTTVVPISMFMPLVAVCVAALATGRLRKLPSDSAVVPVRAKPLLGWLAITTLALSAVPVVQIGLGLVMGTTNWNPRPDAASTASMVPLAALVFVLPSIGEEVGWRGYLQTYLRPRGFWLTAIAIAVLWSIVFHLPVTIESLAQGSITVASQVVSTVNLVCAGVFLAALRERSGSVWPAVWGHALFNSALVFAFGGNLISDGGPLQFWVFSALGWLIWIAMTLAVYFSGARGSSGKAAHHDGSSAAGRE